MKGLISNMSPLSCFAVGKVHLEVVCVDVKEEDSVIPKCLHIMLTLHLLEFTFGRENGKYKSLKT